MDSGNFFVDGKEIEIDFDEEIPPHLLRKLENSPMNQLDAYALRKRIHQLSGFISNSISQTEMRMADIEKSLNEQIKKEEYCQVSLIPKVVDERIHKIVNGKFTSINDSLTAIKADRASIATSLEAFNTQLMERITYVANKTLFGAIKNTYTKRPIRTIIGFAVFSITIFVYVMATLQIHSFSEGWQRLIKLFS